MRGSSTRGRGTNGSSTRGGSARESGTRGSSARGRGITIPAITPTFSSPSRPTAYPEVPHDTSSSHVPLGSHVIHPRAPLSRPVPREPVSRPRWVQLRESPPSTPDAPDEPEGSPDPW